MNVNVWLGTGFMLIIKLPDTNWQLVMNDGRAMMLEQS
jgi:hypothetical protein